MTDDRLSALLTHCQALEQMGLIIIGLLCALCFLHKFPA